MVFTVRGVLVAAGNDRQRWDDLYLAIGYYSMFVFTMKRKRAAENGCVNATSVFRGFLNFVNRHNNSEKCIACISIQIQSVCIVMLVFGNQGDSFLNHDRR